MQALTLNDSLRRVALLLAIGLMASLWLAPLTFAQRPSPEEMKERMAIRTDTLIQQLNLTAEQQDPVRAILEASNAKRLELITAALESGSRMRFEDMDALNEETAMKLGEVLTEEQLAQYKKMQEEQAAQRRQRRGQ